MRRHRISILLLAVLLAAGVLPAFSATSPLSDGAISLLSQARTPQWAAALEADIILLATGDRVPAAAYDFVLAAVGAQAMPADPADAAAGLHAAARAADRARRRGVALPLLRAELRLAWQSMSDGGEGFALRLEQRSQRAVEGFAAGNRRTWDPGYAGRGGSDGGAGGSGPGGRW